MGEVVSSEEIVRRLDLAFERRRTERVVVAMDADGTLWSGDVGHDVFTALVGRRALREAARDALAAEARAHGVEAAGDANDVAAHLLAAFDAERWPEEDAFAAMAWAFAGYLVDEVRAFAREVLGEAKLADRLHREVEAPLAWAKRRGVEVVVVSASPRAVVEVGVELLGIPREHVTAMTPALDGDRVLPRLGEPAVYGDGKVHALERLRPGATLVGAFGDSAYDAAMLRVADVAVGVWPKPKLVALAPTIPGWLQVGG